MLLSTQEQHIRALEAEKAANEQRIRELKEALKLAKQDRFGRKSEALTGEQRQLAEEDTAADRADISRQLRELLPERDTPKQKPVRSELPAEQKRRWRQRYAKPQLEAFRAWLVEQEAGSALGGALHKAVTYALKRWPSLQTYLEDGRVPVDNNRCERVMWPVAQGRRNWLFAGSQRAGERMAGLMSLLETARLNGLEPWAWLCDVLEKLPSWPNNRLDELLPYARKPQQ